MTKPEPRSGPILTGVKVLVCGGRSYADREFVYELLDRLHAEHKFSKLVHGGAHGADAYAGEWAKERGVPLQVYRARWDIYGASAGPQRNKTMLEAEQPQMVVAFPGGGRGTEDMVRRAKVSPYVQLLVKEMPR